MSQTVDEIDEWAKQKFNLQKFRIVIRFRELNLKKIF